MTSEHPPFTSSELANLKASAKAATPGPWEVDDPNDTLVARRDAIGAYCYLVDCVPELCSDHRTQEEERANAKHIASANPETILRLIAMIEWQDEQIEKLRGAMVHFRKMGFEKASKALAATEPLNDKR